MTDEITSTDLAPDTELDASAVVQDAPVVEETPEPVAPKSARETMEAELAKVQAADKEKPAIADKEPAKAEPVKAEPSEGVKPVAAPEVKDAKPSEGKVPEPPARFLPKAREVWANTPNPVKAEIARMEREYAAETETHREARQFKDELSEYDELARQSGTTIKKALTSYVETEKRLHNDPDTELPRVLKAVGLDPIRAVMSILRSAGATPEQFAQHVLQNPQQYVQQQAPRQPQSDPVATQAMQQVSQLQQQIQQMQAQQVQERMNSSVVAPFAADHPRFEELSSSIAQLLNSGMVPDSMSAQERLEAAYDMAERLNPAPYRNAPEAQSDQQLALVNPDAGKKSIKGAPSGGKAPAMRAPSIRELLAQNMPP